MDERRLAVCDLGSNSFRLVVFTWVDGRWWKRTDEIYEPVRVGEGQAEGGPLRPEPMERALETIELFAHFCRATGIDDVRALATSAIREASNRRGVPAPRAGPLRPRGRGALARRGGALRLSRGGELHHAARRRGARYRRRLDAAHAGVGSARDDRVVLAARRRGHDRALPPDPRSSPSTSRRSRAHPRGARLRPLARARRAASSPASAAPSATWPPRRTWRPACLLRRPGVRLSAARSTSWWTAGRHDARRARHVPGIKPERGDVILAARGRAEVMELGGFDALEATDAGLREGVFFSTCSRIATRRCSRTCAAPP